MAQSVKHLTVDFSSGHGLTVREFKPHVGLYAGSADGARLGFCLSQNKLKKNLKKKKRPFKHMGAFVLVPESTHLVWVETVTLWALCIRICDLPRSLRGAHVGRICRGPEASHSP